MGRYSSECNDSELDENGDTESGLVVAVLGSTSMALLSTAEEDEADFVVEEEEEEEEIANALEDAGVRWFT
jgi:hypothetical protein